MCLKFEAPDSLLILFLFFLVHCLIQNLVNLKPEPHSDVETVCVCGVLNACF